VLWLILAIVIDGFVVGALARLAVPGPDPMPIWLTILFGIGGSIVGGIVGRIVFGHVVGGFLLSLLGAIVLVVLYRRFVQHRPVTGPDAHRWP
jgi:uncharacterized membrane protein YeaQ/YmgE (transglycosylase-associated protein family)